MESAINTLVSQFKTYAGKDGSAKTLSKEEFQSLVTSQLPNFVKLFQTCMNFFLLLNTKEDLKNVGNQLMDPIDFHSTFPILRKSEWDPSTIWLLTFFKIFSFAFIKKFIQFWNNLKNSSDPATIDQLMSSLDANNDGELTFLEFWQLIGNVANQHGGF